MKAIAKHFFGLFLLFNIIFFYARFTHPQINYADNPKFDGNKYLKSYHYFRGDSSKYEVRFPFHTRLYCNVLASFFDANVFTVYRVINYVSCAILLLLLLFLAQKINANLSLTSALLAYILLHWAGPVRYYATDVIGVDLPCMLILGVFLLIIYYQNYALLWLWGILCVGIKEIAFPYLAGLLLAEIIIAFKILDSHQKPIFRNYLSKNMLWLIFALITTYLATQILNFYFPPFPIKWFNSSFITLLLQIKIIIDKPLMAISWILGTCIIYSFMVYAVYLKALHININSLSFKYLICSIVAFALSFLGGSDYTRLVMMGFPVVFIFLLENTNRNAFSSPAIFLVFILLLPHTRIWEIIPHPVFEERLCQKWYPEAGAIIENTVFLLYSCFIFFVFKKNFSRLKNGF